VGQSVRTLKQAEVGVPVVVAIREAGISDQTFYPWKAKYFGLEVARQPIRPDAATQDPGWSWVGATTKNPLVESLRCGISSTSYDEFVCVCDKSHSLCPVLSLLLDSELKEKSRRQG